VSIEAMKITKFSHACVRLELDGGVLVVDPGIWTEPEALVGADVILVTHEHNDHIDVPRLAEGGRRVVVPRDAVVDGVPVERVASGEVISVAGFSVRAVGARHAFIHGGQPDVANLGYIVDGSLYIPGDALHVPDEPIETLFVPAQGSWLKTTEAIDFARAIGPQRAFAIHDGALNDRGLGSMNAWYTREIGSAYRWLAPGETA
jgi:L-ascorbate metabolism protein UlaG (beta-lactamase superfamily)